MRVARHLFGGGLRRNLAGHPLRTVDRAGSAASPESTATITLCGRSLSTNSNVTSPKRTTPGSFTLWPTDQTQAPRSLRVVASAVRPAESPGQGSVDDAVVAIRGHPWIRQRNSFTLLTRKGSASRT